MVINLRIQIIHFNLKVRNFNENFVVLHSENKGTMLNYLESYEINRLKYDDILLNDQSVQYQ